MGGHGSMSWQLLGGWAVLLGEVTRVAYVPDYTVGMLYFMYIACTTKASTAPKCLSSMESRQPAKRALVDMT